MHIERFDTGALGANCYIIESDGHYMAVDVGSPQGAAIDRLAQLGSAVELIVLTHRHFDHVMGVAEAVRLTGAKVAVHELDQCGLLSGDDSLYSRYRRMLNAENECCSADILLHDGDSIKLGGTEFEVIHTPGHTEGGICLYGCGILLSGDTLFNASIGRTDFPTGDDMAMQSSLRRLCALPGDTVVYPGHGESTTIGHEAASNPYIIR
ncbi:MAG: MBL fold metallo-hydrolase [Firmicutes bacterium]|nr:MBL fold metallo-hydrolase [Bacillota bacterium]